jgi:hypothetical protein
MISRVSPPPERGRPAAIGRRVGVKTRAIVIQSDAAAHEPKPPFALCAPRVQLTRKRICRRFVDSATRPSNAGPARGVCRTRACTPKCRGGVVRFWGNSGHRDLTASCPTVTQVGHCGPNSYRPVARWEFRRNFPLPAVRIIIPRTPVIGAWINIDWLSGRRSGNPIALSGHALRVNGVISDLQ